MEGVGLPIQPRASYLRLFSPPPPPPIWPLFSFTSGCFRPFHPFGSVGHLPGRLPSPHPPHSPSPPNPNPKGLLAAAASSPPLLPFVASSSFFPFHQPPFLSVLHLLRGPLSATQLAHFPSSPLLLLRFFLFPPMFHTFPSTQFKQFCHDVNVNVNSTTICFSKKGGDLLFEGADCANQPPSLFSFFHGGFSTKENIAGKGNANANSKNCQIKKCLKFNSVNIQSHHPLLLYFLYSSFPLIFHPIPSLPSSLIPFSLSFLPSLLPVFFICP